MNAAVFTAEQGGASPARRKKHKPPSRILQEVRNRLDFGEPNHHFSKRGPKVGTEYAFHRAVLREGVVEASVRRHWEPEPVTRKERAWKIPDQRIWFLRGSVGEEFSRRVVG